MTVTFTQLEFKMESRFADTETLDILKALEAAGTGNALNIQVSLHVTGENVAAVQAGIEQLHAKNVLGAYEYDHLTRNIEGFKALYLR